MSKRWQIKWRKSCFRSTFSFSSFSLSPPSTLLLIIFLFSFIPLRSSKPLLVSEGYWAEPWALTEMPLCAVIDPSKDFRWHALGCGGPETAGFLCEMEGEPFWLVLNVNVNEKLIDDFSLSFSFKHQNMIHLVPDWAIQCTEQPDVTVQYISDNGNVELTRSCKNFEKSLACQNNMDKIAVLNELKCPEDDVLDETTTPKDDESSSSSSTEMMPTTILVEQTSSESSIVMESQTPVVVIAVEPKVLTVEKLSFDDDVILPLAEINDNQLDVDTKRNDDLMMGDQPAEDSEILPSALTPAAAKIEDDKKFLLKQSDKLKKDIEPKKKSTKKEQLKVKNEEEHMMGDAPAAEEIPTTDGRQRRDADETTQPMLATTEEIIVSSSTIQSTDLSTTEDATTVTVDTVEISTEIPETTSTIQSTTATSTTTTEQPTTKFIVQGHPLFHSQTVFKDPIPQYNPENTNANLERKDVGNTDDHFVPPMLLVKSRFQAKASEHDEQAKDTTTEIVTESNYEFNMTDINDDNSTDVNDLSSVDFTTLSSTTLADENNSASSTTPSPSNSTTAAEAVEDSSKPIKVDKRNDPRLGLNAVKTTSKPALTTVESYSTSPEEPEDVSSSTTEESSSVTEMEQQQEEVETMSSTDSSDSETTILNVEIPSTTETNEASTFATAAADSLIVTNEAATTIAEEKSTVSPTTENAVEILSSTAKHDESPVAALIESSTSAKQIETTSEQVTVPSTTSKPKPMKPTATIAQQFNNEINDHYHGELETESAEEDEERPHKHVENNLNNEDYQPYKPPRHRSITNKDHHHGSGMRIGQILGK